MAEKQSPPMRSCPNAHSNLLDLLVNYFLQVTPVTISHDSQLKRHKIRRFYRKTASRIVQRTSTGQLQFNFGDLPNPNFDFDGAVEIARQNLFQGVIVRMKQETNFADLSGKAAYKALIRKLLHLSWTESVKTTQQLKSLDENDGELLKKLNKELTFRD